MLRLARGLGVRLLMAALAVALVEGLASGILLLWDVVRTPRVGESFHTRYDPDLGWVNVPGLSWPDLYGPGLGLTTNSRGFRAVREVHPHVTPGRIRVICSGDSFTLGYGVRDSDTWCEQLRGVDARIEPVNMGQAGYGLDQAFLWLKRDARALDHQVELLAFISDDFDRIRDAERMGYGKPFLDVEDEHLVVKNVPVSRRPWLVPWITRNLESIRSLRSYQLACRLLQGDAGVSGSRERSGPRATVRRIVSMMLEDLARTNRAKHTTLVLVYLPYLPEHGSVPPWSRFMRRESDRLGIPLIDVAYEFRTLPRRDAEALFIPDEGAFPGAGGHLSVRGHKYVAWVIGKHLATLAAFRDTSEPSTEGESAP
jgi:hypothetical protein